MQPKPAVAVLFFALWGSGAVHAAPVLPTVVLFPRTSTNPADLLSLADVRKALRRDGQTDVLTFDPNGSAFKRAASDAHHPEWLTTAVDDAGRAAVTRGVGAQFYATVAAGEGGRADVRLVDAGGSGHAWILTAQKTADAARQMETDMAGAIDYALALPAPAPLAPLKITENAAPPPAAAPRLPNIVPRLPNIVPPAPIAAKTIAPPAPVKAAVLPPPVTAAVQPSSASPAQALPNVVPPAPPIKIATLPPAPPVKITLPPSAPPVKIATLPPAVYPPAPHNSPAIVHAPFTNAATTVHDLSMKPPTTVHDLSVVAPARALLRPNAAPARVLPKTMPAPAPADLRAAAALQTQAADALSRADTADAVSLLRQAINLVPLLPAPRVALSRAYLQAGMTDRAADEARRAVELDPDAPSVQQLLTDLDAATGTANGAVARATALLAQTPHNPFALLSLGDAQAQNGDSTQAEASYRDAVRLSPAGSPARTDARAHLAQFYAAQSRYAECLVALAGTGRTGYALALTIVQTRADALAQALDMARAQFDGGKTTHEAFYKSTTDAQAQAQGLADFVAKLLPPPTFSLSHAHRVLAVQLLTQQAAVLVSYVETGSGTQAARASELEKAAQTEMLTAHAAETTLGLWNNARSANN